jgi:hypothetical protein
MGSRAGRLRSQAASRLHGLRGAGPVGHRHRVSALWTFPSAVPNDPEVEDWFAGSPEQMRALARTWFERMRRCGPDVRELIHDGCPVACLGDAAFGYVNAFTAHVNVGFFHGAELDDPAGLLEGTGKRMRHVKLRPGEEPDGEALAALISAAYQDVWRRLWAP